MSRTFYINFYPNALEGCGDADVYLTKERALKGRGLHPNDPWLNTADSMTIEVVIPDPEPPITIRAAL